MLDSGQLDAVVADHRELDNPLIVGAVSNRD
jgi:hypothetical protein